MSRGVGGRSACWRRLAPPATRGAGHAARTPGAGSTGQLPALKLPHVEYHLLLPVPDPRRAARSRLLMVSSLDPSALAPWALRGMDGGHGRRRDGVDLAPVGPGRRPRPRPAPGRGDRGGGGARRRRLLAVHHHHVCARPRARRAAGRRTTSRGAARRSRVLRAGHAVGLGGRAHGLGQRPDRASSSGSRSSRSPLYVLAAFHRRRARSGEAGMKYFVLGAFSSAFFLYGIALVYGATGHDVARRHRHVPVDPRPAVQRRAAGRRWRSCWSGWASRSRPCRSSRGRPTSTRARRPRRPRSWPAVAKTAGFAALLRIFLLAFPTQAENWRPLIWVLAVLTMVVGSVLAIVQDDVKRMLAYSSISHAGYVLLGLQAATATGPITRNGLAGPRSTSSPTRSWCSAASPSSRSWPGRATGATGSSDYRGLAAERPALALAFTVLLLSQAGIPFTTRVLRQVRRHQRGARPRAGARLHPRRGGHAGRGGLGLLLPAHRAGHVPGAGPRRRRGPRRAAARHPRGDAGAGLRVCPSRRRPWSSAWRSLFTVALGDLPGAARPPRGAGDRCCSRASEKVWRPATPFTRVTERVRFPAQLPLGGRLRAAPPASWWAASSA